MAKNNSFETIMKILSIVLILLGGYYLLVAIQIIPSQIILGDYYLDNRTLGIIAIIIIAIGLFLNENIRKKIKNAFL